MSKKLTVDNLSRALGLNANELQRAVDDARAHEQKPTCKWTYDEWDDKWEGDCGIAWQFTSGNTEENGVYYCPRCGRRLEVDDG